MNGNEHEMQPASLAPEPAGISITLELVVTEKHLFDKRQSQAVMPDLN